MNTQNFAGLEACKRLVDAGIVLETEKYFRVFDEEIAFITAWQKKCWEAEIKVDAASDEVMFIPAPCCTEVWRELPAGTSLHKIDGHYNGYMLEYTPSNLRNGNVKFRTHSTNTTDALIDLLIWVRKAKP